MPDAVVHGWVLGLPGPNPAIVSLLGRKPDGTSEFWFYSFFGGFDTAAENPGKISFHEWLDRSYPAVLLREHPTCDLRPIEPALLPQIADDIRSLMLLDGRTVVVFDSGGQQRTGAVSNFLGAVEDSSTP